MSYNIYENGQLKRIAGNSIMDAALDANSTNGVQNKVVTEAITQLNNDLGSKSSASAVTGNDAFSKINTLKNNIDVIGNYYYNEDSFNSNASNTRKRCATIDDCPAGRYLLFGYVTCSKNLPTVEFIAELRDSSTTISVARGYCNSGGGLNLIAVVNVGSTCDLNVAVYDTMGNSTRVNGFLRAIRLY